MTAGTRPTRLVFPVMGTMCSIAVAASDAARLGGTATAAALAGVRTYLEAMDHRFSHYTRTSEISRWMAGEAVSPDAIADIDHVLRQCLRLREESDGVFSINNPISGAVDTAGYVKGYAIGRAAQRLRDAGLRNFIVGVGGDTFCSGRAAAERPWRLAVADPRRSHGVLALIESTDLAVATSGRSERGDHIWNGDRRATTHLMSFTVTGPDIAEADAYATIGFAMGEAGIAWVASRDGYRSLAVRPDGSVVGDAALVSAA